MFPRHVLEFMIKDSLARSNEQKLLPDLCPGGGDSLANSHDNVTIMFMDIVGFTTMSKEVQPVEVSALLLSTSI